MTDPTTPKPQPPKEPRLHVAEILTDSSFLVQLANAMLNTAELNRRKGVGTFAPRDPQSGNPDDDWAIAAILISRAQAHLDEALPGGQLVRTRAALGALRIGVKLLTAALEAQGVQPARLSNLELTTPAEAASEPSPRQQQHATPELPQ